MRCYLFDLDGTLCNIDHRLHHIQNGNKNWDAFYAACLYDEPIPHMVELARTLSKTAPIVYVSGRSDAVRLQTCGWFGANGLPATIRPPLNDLALYMRKHGDHRQDHVVKLELLQQILADGFKPIMAFDDRNQVVEMWRANGIPCAQVAPGDF